MKIEILQMNRIILMVLLMLGSFYGYSQEGISQDSMKINASKSKRYSLIALPAVFFAPETNWGFGGLGSLAFRFKNEALDSRPSQIQLGFAYTLNKQYLLYLPFQLFVNEAKFKYYGEVGYFLYTYIYYGIGNDKTDELREVYEVQFPRVRLNALYMAKPDFYVGLRYWMDNFDITEYDPDGDLIKGEVPGSNGSFLSGFGTIFNYDNRDKIFYPESGKFAELILFHNGATFGSDFNFSKVILDASTYYRNKWQHIFAINWYSEFTFGTAPFNQLALLGSTKKLRGNFEGRFRDNHQMLIQGEYRMPLFWRFGAVVFGGVGRVAPSFADLGFDNMQ